MGVLLCVCGVNFPHSPVGLHSYSVVINDAKIEEHKCHKDRTQSRWQKQDMKQKRKTNLNHEEKVSISCSVCGARHDLLRSNPMYWDNTTIISRMKQLKTLTTERCQTHNENTQVIAWLTDWYQRCSNQCNASHSLHIRNYLICLSVQVKHTCGVYKQLYHATVQKWWNKGHGPASGNHWMC